MSNDERDYKLLDELQLKLWKMRRELTYSRFKWQQLRQCATPTHNLLHQLLLDMEKIRDGIVAQMNIIKPPKEDETIPYLHWADATPNQRKLIWEGVALRGYEPQDEDEPRAKKRRTDMPR